MIVVRYANRGSGTSFTETPVMPLADRKDPAMETIVNRIIEIDRQADEKLAAADTEQRQLLADAKAKAARRRDEILADADRQIAERKAQETAALEQKRAALLQQQEDAVRRLDQTFAAQRDQLEEDLFHAILGV